MKTESKPQWQPIAVSLTLLVLLAAAYWPVFDCTFINFDDTDYVTENFVVRRGLTLDGLRWAFSTTPAANWHPLTWVSHMLDCSVFALNPAGHHATNFLFHAINSLLLFALLKRMTGALWRSALVAALFALHPLRVESVAWIAERKDVLSAFFGLLSLWVWTLYVFGAEGSIGGFRVQGSGFILRRQGYGGQEVQRSVALASLPSGTFSLLFSSPCPS